MSPSITGDLMMTELDIESGSLWRLEQSLSFGGSQITATVPSGFVTDGASVPRPLWWFLPAWGRYSRAAVIHDYLCQTNMCTRKVADDTFYEAMVVCGVNTTIRWMMWASVRLYAILARK